MADQNLELGGDGAVPAPPQLSAQAEACAICRNGEDLLSPGDTNFAMTPCRHGPFHLSCLAYHLRVNGTCPTCRTDIEQLDAAGAALGGAGVPAAADASSSDDEPRLVCMAPGCCTPQIDGCLAVCDWPDCTNAICKVGCPLVEIPDSAVLEGPGRKFLLCPDHANRAFCGGIGGQEALFFEPDPAASGDATTGADRAARYAARCTRVAAAPFAHQRDCRPRRSSKRGWRKQRRNPARLPFHESKVFRSAKKRGATDSVALINFIAHRLVKKYDPADESDLLQTWGVQPEPSVCKRKLPDFDLVMPRRMPEEKFLLRLRCAQKMCKGVAKYMPSRFVSA